MLYLPVVRKEKKLKKDYGENPKLFEKLRVLRKKLADEQKVGAYGLPSSTQTIENTSSFVENNYRLLVGKDLVFTKDTRYYFIDANKNFVVANKKNLLKLLPGQKTRIENYLKTHDIDFKNENALKELLMFL